MLLRASVLRQKKKKGLYNDYGLCFTRLRFNLAHFMFYKIVMERLEP